MWRAAERPVRPRRGGAAAVGKLAGHKEFLLARVAEEPVITMLELAAALAAATGTTAAPASLSRFLIRHGWCYKKRASEQERADVRRRREEWTRRRQPHMRQEPRRLVVLDETGTTTKMTRLRGRGPLGARLRMQAPFGHWRTQTFIAALRCDGLTARPGRSTGR